MRVAVQIFNCACVFACLVLQRLCVIDASSLDLKGRWRDAITKFRSEKQILDPSGVPSWMPLAKLFEKSAADLQCVKVRFYRLYELSAACAAAHSRGRLPQQLSKMESLHPALAQLLAAFESAISSADVAQAAAEAAQKTHQSEALKEWTDAVAAMDAAAVEMATQQAKTARAMAKAGKALSDHELYVRSQNSSASVQSAPGAPDLLTKFETAFDNCMLQWNAIGERSAALHQSAMAAPLELSKDVWLHTSARDALWLTMHSFTDCLRGSWSQHSPLNAELGMFRSSSLVPFLAEQLLAPPNNTPAQMSSLQGSFLRHFCFSAQFMINDTSISMRTQPLLATRTLTQLSGHRFHVIISPGQERKLSALALEVALRSNAAAHIEGRRTRDRSYPQIRDIYNAADTRQKDQLTDLASVLKFADVRTAMRTRMLLEATLPYVHSCSRTLRCCVIVYRC